MNIRSILGAAGVLALTATAALLICSDPDVKQDRIAATDVRDLLVELALTDPGKD